MIITKISLKNVRRYFGEQTIEFSSPHGPRRIHLIGAYNGTGKTTLFQAIEACLFASKAAPILKAKDITRTSAHSNLNEMAVQIEFQHESQSYFLKRTWTRQPGPREYSISSVSLSSLFQNMDSGDTSTDEDEIADFMDTLIPYMTRRLFLFDGEQVQTYIDEASNSVRDAIERLLGLHLYIQLENDIKKVEQDLRQERSSHDVSEALLGKQDVLDRNETSLRSIERRRAELRRGAVDVKSELSRLQTEETRLEGLFDPKLQARKRELESQKETLVSDIERHELMLAEMASKEVALSWFWSEIAHAIKQSSTEVAHLPVTVGAFATFLYEHRTVLLLALESNSKETVDETLNRCLGHYTDDGSSSSLRYGLHVLADLIQSRSETFISYPEQLKDMRLALDRINHELSSLPSADTLDIDVSKLHEELGALLSTQARHEESIKTLSREKERLDTEAEDLKRDLDRLSGDNEKYKALTYAVDLCRQLRDILEIFVSDYRSTRIGQLQTIVNHKFQELTNAPGLVKSIEIDRDNVELRLIGRDSKLLAEEQSAGQKEVLAFALIASVVDLSNRQVPAIIDTPLARLDVQHRTNVLRRFFPYLGPQVIILATDSEVAKEEIDILSYILASQHHLYLDPDTGYTTIKDGYLDY